MPKNKGLRRWLAYKYVTFVRIKDEPKSIAAGAALGIAFDILPTLGLGVFVSYFLAAILKVNRLATVISAVVFKLGIPFFCYINMKMGRLIVNEPIRRAPELGHYRGSFHFDWSVIGVSFLIGSIVNAIIFAVLTYVISYQFVCWRRNRTATLKSRARKQKEEGMDPLR